MLIGPTASGKTDIALEIASRHEMEVVSVDSMQVYREMDIGTAKPSTEERRRVSHHMIDVVDPAERFNVAKYRDMALKALEDIWSRGRRPLLICGTPLYLKALLWGLFEGPGRDHQFREKLREKAKIEGKRSLHERLSRVDPDAADRICPNDLRRVIRALEVFEITGEPISARQTDFWKAPVIPNCMVGIRWERSELYRRIEGRVEQMLGDGLVDEVRGLRGRLGPQASQAVGYKELISFLEGDHSFEEATRLIKRNTRHLAKDQISWFRRFPVVEWVDAQEGENIYELAQRCEFIFAQNTQLD